MSRQDFGTSVSVVQHFFSEHEPRCWREEAEKGQNVAAAGDSDRMSLSTPSFYFSLQNPSQKVVQKLAAEVWNRLPQEAKREDWSGVEKAEQMQFIKIAQEVLASD